MWFGLGDCLRRNYGDVLDVGHAEKELRGQTRYMGNSEIWMVECEDSDNLHVNMKQTTSRLSVSGHPMANKSGLSRYMDVMHSYICCSNPCNAITLPSPSML